MLTPPPNLTDSNLSQGRREAVPVQADMFAETPVNEGE